MFFVCPFLNPSSFVWEPVLQRPGFCEAENNERITETAVYPVCHGCKQRIVLWNVDGRSYSSVSVVT